MLGTRKARTCVKGCVRTPHNEVRGTRVGPPGAFGPNGTLIIENAGNLRGGWYATPKLCRQRLVSMLEGIRARSKSRRGV